MLCDVPETTAPPGAMCFTDRRLLRRLSHPRPQVRPLHLHRQGGRASGTRNALSPGQAARPRIFGGSPAPQTAGGGQVHTRVLPPLGRRRQGVCRLQDGTTPSLSAPDEAGHS